MLQSHTTKEHNLFSSDNIELGPTTSKSNPLPEITPGASLQTNKDNDIVKKDAASPGPS